MKHGKHMMAEKEMKKPSPHKSKKAPKNSGMSECPGWIKGKHIGPHKGLKMMKDSDK